MFDSVWRWSLENVIFNAFWRDVAVAVVIFLLFLLARGLFVRFIFRMILGLTSKTKTDLDNAILLAFESPLKAFF